MRTIPGGLASHLAGDSLTLAVLVRVERRDGVIKGFSSHDRELTFGGLAYEPTASIDATDIASKVGPGVDNLDLFGIVSSDSIPEAELLAGLYDGASVLVSLVNWKDLAAGSIVLLSGYIGNLTVREGAFVAEVRALSSRFGLQIGKLTSPACRVRALGDSECGVTLGSFQFARTVYSVSDARRRFVFDADANVSGYYDYGRVLFTSGANSGLISEVKIHTLVSGRADITIQEALPYDVLVGDGATLEAGCDRRIETCIAKFSNAVNFRGEPHVPGTDQVLKRGRP